MCVFVCGREEALLFEAGSHVAQAWPWASHPHVTLMTIWKICLTNSHWSSKCRNTSENIKKKCFYFVSIKKTKTKLDVLSCGLGLRLFNELRLWVWCQHLVGQEGLKLYEIRSPWYKERFPLLFWYRSWWGSGDSIWNKYFLWEKFKYLLICYLNVRWCWSWNTLLPRATWLVLFSSARQPDTRRKLDMVDPTCWAGWNDGTADWQQYAGWANLLLGEKASLL